jgi:hypothetical protein
MAEHTRRTVQRGTAGLAPAGALTGLGAGRAAAHPAGGMTDRHYPFLEGRSPLSPRN